MAADCELDKVQMQLKQREAAIQFLILEFEGAITAFRARGAGGQQVPYHGVFASMAPSTVATLERYIRELRDCLEDKWPIV